MRAMLLCAGKGTRLGAMSAQRPKPLLPVCDIPIVRFGVAKLVSCGIRDIVINLHHQGQLIIDELGDGSDLGAHIVYSWEKDILGTGGGLKHALPLLDPEGRDEPFLSLNGKLIFDLDILGLQQAFAKQPGDCLGMMVVKAAPNALSWGAVDVQPEEGQMRVRNILGQGSYMFCGVHLTRPSVVAGLPEGEACMVRQGYLPWIQRGGRVAAFEHKSGYFAEHSTPRRYLQSNVDLLQDQELTFAPAELRGVHPSAQVHESCTLIEPYRIGENARVAADCRIGPNVVVGVGSRVAEGSILQDSVIWPNTSVSGEHSECIVTPQAILSADGADDVDAGLSKSERASEDK